MHDDGLPADRPHVHLVSDSTGETVSTAMRACLVQFQDHRPHEHLWWMVRTPGQVDRVLTGISQQPGLVLFTLVNPETRARLEEGCRALGIQAVGVLDGVLSALRRHLDTAKFVLHVLIYVARLV